jgi:hypothetical protein
MASTYQVLGQSNPAATTNTDVYTVPSSTSAVVSTITICNQGVSGTFNIAIRPAGASITAKQYIAYGATLNANDSLTLTLGLSLATTDVVTVYASTANFSFNVFGVQLT